MTKNLKNLEKKILECKAKKESKKERKRKYELKQEEKGRKFLEKEKTLLEKKIHLNNEILEWRDEFVKSKQFKDIWRFYEDFNTGIKIFHGVLNYGKGSLWCHINLKKSGELRYTAGYGRTIEEVSTLDGAVSRLTYDYLNKLNEHIKSGEIYEAIIKELESYKNFWLT